MIVSEKVSDTFRSKRMGLICFHTFCISENRIDISFLAMPTLQGHPPQTVPFQVILIQSYERITDV